MRQRVTSLVIVHTGTEDQAQDLTLWRNQWSARVAVAHICLQNIGLALVSSRRINIRASNNYVLRHARRRGFKGAGLGKAQHYRVIARTSFLLRPLHGLQGQVGGPEQGDVVKRIVVHDVCVSHADHSFQPNSGGAGDHVRVGENQIRCDDKARALQQAFALRGLAQDSDDGRSNTVDDTLRNHIGVGGFIGDVLLVAEWRSDGGHSIITKLTEDATEAVTPFVGRDLVNEVHALGLTHPVGELPGHGGGQGYGDHPCHYQRSHGLHDGTKARIQADCQRRANGVPQRLPRHCSHRVTNQGEQNHCAEAQKNLPRLILDLRHS